MSTWVSIDRPSVQAMSAAEANATARQAAVREVWISVDQKESQNHSRHNATSNRDAETSGQTQHDQGASESAEIGGSRHQASVEILDPGFRLNAPLPNEGEFDQTPSPTEAGHSADGEGMGRIFSVLSNFVEPARSDHFAGRVDSVEPTAMMERHVQGVEPDRNRAINLRYCVHRRWKLTLFISISSSVLLFAAIIVIIVLARNQSSGDSNNGGGRVTNTPSSSPTAPSRVDTIRNQGYLTCGIVEYRGLSMRDSEPGNWSGFEVDLCRAVGAAIFQKDGHVRFVNSTYTDRFGLLQSTQVDLLAAAATYTMERDIYEPSAKAGFTFSVPYLYDGLVFAGVPKYVACADQHITDGNCTDIRICVQDGTTHVEVMKNLFNDSSVIHLAQSTRDFYNNFVQGLCTVLAGEQLDLLEINVRQVGYKGSYSFGKNIHSKEPIALVTRDDDAVWSDFVNWVLLALLAAEKQSITKQVAQSTVVQAGLAVDLSHLQFYYALATVGNYAEMYSRHLESMVPRASVNQQNNRTSPLIYSFPFGSIATFGPKLATRGTIERILDRGHLLCGTAETLFFANFNRSRQEWEGFDVDYCRAVSSAILKGMGNTLFVPVTAEARWEMLQNGTIDLLSWDTTWNYERDWHEPSTKTGFTFAQPAYYTGLQFGGVPQYLACAEDVNVQIECSELTICVKDGTTIIKALRKLFSNKSIIPWGDDQQVFNCLLNNTGNAMAADGFFTATATVREKGYTGPYQGGTKLFSLESLAVVTRQDDPRWSSFVNWVVMATFYAAEQNITQTTSTSMPATNLFGEGFTTMLQDAIAAVGSHSDILARNAKGKYSVSAINKLNLPPYGPLHFPPSGLFGL